MPSTGSTHHFAVAVIGCGHWGKNLVRNFHQLGSLKLLCEKNDTLVTQFKEHYPGLDTCIALNDVLSRQDIHGVVISTPAETHYVLAREALLAGKHVYVEKPLVLLEEQAEELIAIAERNGLVLMVGHLLQYHPVFQHLKTLAVGGELGRINYIYSNRLNLGKIRREENILWSFAPHDISMILALAEEEPESVVTTGGNYLHQQIADVTTTHLEFSSGLRAHIFVSWLHPFKEQKLVVVGDHKMAVFDDTQPWEEKLLLYPHEIKWRHNMPIPAKAEPEQVAVPQEEPLRQECQHFLECMAGGATPLTDGYEGLRVLRVLNASQHSLDEDSRKVYLQGFAPEKPPKSEDKLAPYFVHETSIVDEGVTIGEGTKIWHFSHVLSGSRIGQQCNIGQNVVIGPDVTIGTQCKIQNNVSVYKGVTLEDGVFCGPSMVFTNILNPRAEIRKMDQLRSTLLKRGASVGANATIVCGTTLGRYCFVGAGAVVTHDVPDHALVVGNPARRIGWMCVCGERLDAGLICQVCGKRYEPGTDGLCLKD
ncbi:oxidoreductase [candidate division KSB3 bacterium]|uniref:Oxidoreductase n=1 Tax=candidate division KSB3 bacterium TaxID=2044937 RepID=A0A9D5Q617_9BACT|nr:oxidoreductase [candidate division KSB3 bacterium]MBD3325230.1 oxidoreductase [candidate division KSB3 bacterium]